MYGAISAAPSLTTAPSTGTSASSTASSLASDSSASCPESTPLTSTGHVASHLCVARGRHGSLLDQLHSLRRTQAVVRHPSGRSTALRISHVQAPSLLTRDAALTLCDTVISRVTLLPRLAWHPSTQARPQRRRIRHHLSLRLSFWLQPRLQLCRECQLLHSSRGSDNGRKATTATATCRRTASRIDVDALLEESKEMEELERKRELRRAKETPCTPSRKKRSRSAGFETKRQRSADDSRRKRTKPLPAANPAVPLIFFQGGDDFYVDAKEVSASPCGLLSCQRPHRSGGHSR